MFSTKCYLDVENGSRKTSPSKPDGFASSPARGASGEKGKFPVLPRPLLGRSGGIAKQ